MIYGLLVHMTAAPGKRDALIAILVESSEGLAGCFSSVVAWDSTNSDGIWTHGGLGKPSEPQGLALSAFGQRGDLARQTTNRTLR